MLRSFAVDIIKRMLQRRLDPKAYIKLTLRLNTYILRKATLATVPSLTQPPLQTFLMLRGCLSTGSDEFVAYIKSDIEPFVSQFYSKDGTGESMKLLDLC